LADPRRPRSKSSLFQRIGTDLADPGRLLAEIAARERRERPDRPAEAGEPAPPRTPAEEILAELWAEVLGIERVGIRDDFFTLGGQSLLATQVLSRAGEAFGVDLPLRALFEARTVEALARRIEEERGTESAGAPEPVRPRPAAAGTPLSFAQERLWFLDRFEPGSAAYHIPAAFRLRGALDSGALARALAAIVQRHEVLRTVFPEIEGRPEARVLPPDPSFPLPRVDLTGLAGHTGEREALRLAAEEPRRSFDLARGPLLRALLLRLAADDHLLAVDVHHIAADGWSLNVLIREVDALYRAFAAGLPGGLTGSLPPLPVQYADWALWQRGRLSGGALENRLAEWTERLAGLPPLDLPADHPRPAAETFRGARRPLTLAPDLAAGIAALARAQGATPFMVLLAAFAALLGRLSGQEDLAVGSPVAGRARPEIEPLIGLFLNTVALRADLAGDPAFIALLARTRETALAAFAAQDLPFERLVDALRPERSLGRSPLFQVLFVLQNQATAPLRLADLEIRPVEIDPGIARFDLALSLTALDGGLAGYLEHRTDLFDAATAERWAGHLTTLLAGAVADPARRLGDLPLLTAAERTALLAAGTGPGPDAGDGGALVHRLIAAQAARTPEAVAAACAGTRLTYGDLIARSGELAGRLRALGVGTEVVVAVAVERSLDLLVAPLGVLEAGGAYLPLDPSYPAERLAFMLRDSGAAVIVTRGHLAEALPVQGMAVALLDEVDPHPREVPPSPGGREGMGEGVGGEGLAYLIYTSGSTGQPKGVQVPHGALANFLASMRREPGLRGDDVLLAVTSLSFDIAALELFLPLLAGARLEIATAEETADGARLLSRLAASGATALQATPATWRMLLDAGWEEPRLRLALCGGEAMPADLAVALGARADHLWNVYGPTETAVWSTVFRVEDAMPVGPPRIVPIGRPIAATRTHVLDRWGSLAPPGVPGELWIGGTGVARGYRGRPALTAERFVPDPFPSSGDSGGRSYRTGDLVRRRSDGILELLGRIDHQVKVRGFRIELGEIETALAGHPGVAQAVVVLREGGDRGGERRLVAYMVPAGEAPTPAALRDWLRGRLPEPMQPAAFVFLPSLPLTPNRKVDRRALPAPEAETAAVNAYAAPRDPAEGMLAGLFAEVLGFERVGIDDSFFALGGHSLLATRLAARVRRLFGVDLPVRDLFESPTVRRLAARLASGFGDAPAAPPIVPVPRDGDLPLSFAQQRLWFLDRLEAGNPWHHIPAALRLTGDLDVSALRGALAGIARRHEALRTTFPATDGLPRQEIAPAAAAENLELPVADLSALPASPRDAELARLLAATAARPFDLARGPLLRMLLLRLNAGEHALAAVVHHIVFDAWSTGLFVRELSALYAEKRPHPRPLSHLPPTPPPGEGRKAETASSCLPSPGVGRAGDGRGAGGEGASRSALPALPVQYADFAAWQRRWLTGETLDRLLAGWRARLAGAPAALDLPTDRPHPPVQTFRGGSVPFRPAAGSTSLLGALCRAAGVTPFMVLLAAFQTLLCRAGGQEDLVVGTPVAGRTREEVENLIGAFLNTLALRGDLSGGPTFRGLLGRLREVCLEAYALQDLPFEKLVEELRPARDLARAPLFQTLIVLHNASPGELDLPGLALAPIPLASGGAQFELALWLGEAEGRLAGTLEHNADLFDRATAARLAGHLERLLAAALDAPETPIAGLPLMDAAERDQVLAQWGDGGPAPAPARLHDLVAAQAARTPENVAVAVGGEALTYRQLEERAAGLAQVLRGRGVGPETPVGVCLERTLALPVALLAVLKAGGAYVPLDPAWPAERLALMLEDSGAAGILSEPALRGAVPHSPSVWVIEVDDDASSAFLPSPGDREGGAGRGAGGEGTLAYILYTSGSTGRPKGVQVPHAALTAFLLAMLERPGLGPDDVLVAVTSLSFDIAGLELFLPLLAGAKVVLASRREAQDGALLQALLARSGATVLQATPAGWRLLLAAGWSGDPKLTALCGGEALPPDLASALASRTAALWNLYGPTETTVWSTVHQVAAGADPLIGRPIAGTTVRVLDAEGAPVPAGIPGELCIGGAGVARGYRGRPDLTAERFVPDPWSPLREGGARLYRTGDRARFRPDGTLEYLSRIDHQVKVRGFRVEPGEIEAVLAEHPGVAQAVVVARPGAGAERVLTAYVVPADGMATDPASWRDHLRARLPEYMVPSAWATLAALPLTPNGKIDRRVLSAPDRSVQSVRSDRSDRSEAGADPAFEAPQSRLEQSVAEVWRGFLGVERIGLRDNFFDLGGHSLLMARVQSRLRELLGREIAMVDLFSHPTVGGLARYLAQGVAQGNGESGEEVRSRVERRAEREEVGRSRLHQLRQGSRAARLSREDPHE
jgi:amino acid adenylation domain-containing protein